MLQARCHTKESVTSLIQQMLQARCHTKEPVTSLIQQMLQQWSHDRSRTFVFGFYEISLLKLVVPDETSEISDGSHIRVQPVSRDVTSVDSDDVLPDWTQPDSTELGSVELTDGIGPSLILQSLVLWN